MRIGWVIGSVLLSTACSGATDPGATGVTEAVVAVPIISLGARSSPPGTSVTLAGSGFMPGANVLLAFDGDELKTVVANATGGLSVSIEVPASAEPGAHEVEATEADGPSATAELVVRTNWNQFRFDESGTGDNPYENILNASNVSGLQLRWSAAYNGGGSSPAVASGRVYVGSKSWIYAFSANTGALAWQHKIGSVANSSPAALYGRVYVGGDAGVLYALDHSTGKLAWKGAPDSGGQPEFSSPAVDRQKVYLSWNSGTLTAFAAAGCGGLPMCKPVWTADIGGNLAALASPVTAAGHVYAVGGIFQLGVARLSAFDDASCSRRATRATTRCPAIWSVATRGPLQSSPALAGDVLYVVSRASNDAVPNFLVAYDASTGNELWASSYLNDQAPIPSPTVANGHVFVSGFTNGQGFIRVYDAATGALDWSAITPTLVYGSPAVAADVVYLQSAANLFAFPTSCGTGGATCAPIWAGPAEVQSPCPCAAGSLNAMPAVSDGRLFAAVQSNQIQAFALPAPPGSP